MPRRPRQVARRGEVTSSLPFVLSLSKHGPSFRRSTKRTALRQAQGERSLVRFKTRSQMTLRMPAEWAPHDAVWIGRSEEHTSELQSLMRISYAVFCLNKKNIPNYKQ